MICSEDTQNAVALILGLDGRPATNARWDPPVYQCTYLLREGPLRLSVTEDGSAAAALRDFHALQSQYAHAGAAMKSLPNFGIPAFLAADDVVAFVKDDKILRVDATSLPATVGPSHRTRRDTTYIVAASVLHCWNGS